MVKVHHSTGTAKVIEDSPKIKKNFSLCCKIVSVALMAIFGLVMIFSLFAQAPQRKSHVNFPQPNSPIIKHNLITYESLLKNPPPQKKFNPAIKKLSSSHLASFQNGHCILPTKIASDNDFKNAVTTKINKLKNSSPNFNYNYKDGVVKSRIREVNTTNCETVVKGICTIENPNLKPEEKPQPQDYNRMQRIYNWIDENYKNNIFHYVGTQFKSILCNINKFLTTDSTTGCENDAQMISSGILCNKIRLFQSTVLPPLNDFDAVITYLIRNDRSMLDTYVSISDKINDLPISKVKIVFQNLRHKEKQFIENYKISVEDGKEVSVDMLNDLSNTTESLIRDNYKYPFYVVSKLYHSILVKHPFSNENFKTAYVFMNFILTRLGFDPVIYTDIKEPLDLHGVQEEKVQEFKDKLIFLSKSPKSTTSMLEECEKKIKECSDHHLIGEKKHQECNVTIH